jgi:hypothetical protein
MTKTRFALLVLPCLTLFACSKSPEETAAAMMDEVVSIIEANKADCAALGEKMLAWLKANGQKLNKNMDDAQAKYKSLSKEDAKAMREKYRERAMKSQAALREAGQQCRDNPQVTAAVKALR